MSGLKLLGMVFFGAMAFCGFFIGLIGMFMIVTHPEERAGNIAMTVFLGYCPGLFGSYACRFIWRHHKDEKMKNLEREIFVLAKEKKGRLGVLDLAMVTDFSAEEAKSFLDDLHSRGLVEMEVLENGDLFYRFPLS